MHAVVADRVPEGASVGMDVRVRARDGTEGVLVLGYTIR
jgi:hypothetical protein